MVNVKGNPPPGVIPQRRLHFDNRPRCLLANIERKTATIYPPDFHCESVSHFSVVTATEEVATVASFIDCARIISKADANASGYADGVHV